MTSTSSEHQSLLGRGANYKFYEQKIQCTLLVPLLMASTFVVYGCYRLVGQRFGAIGRVANGAPFIFASVFVTAAAEDFTRIRLQRMAFGNYDSRSSIHVLSALANELDRAMIVITAVYVNVLLVLVLITDRDGSIPRDLPWRTLLDSTIGGVVVIVTFLIQRCSHPANHTSRTDEYADTHFYSKRWTVLWVTQVILLVGAWAPNADRIARTDAGFLWLLAVLCIVVGAMMGQTRSLQWSVGSYILGLCWTPVSKNTNENKAKWSLLQFGGHQRRIMWLATVFVAALTFMLYLDHVFVV